MAVTASAGDADGAAIDARITALTTKVSQAPTVTVDSARQLLDQTQREAVYHYLNRGRITAASILSTLS